nr:hypothetical protein [Tanacetum cinerariifolium]
MGEPSMEEYMTKTREGYGSRIVKINEKAQFELKDMQELISFYKGLDVPTRQILNSKGAIPSMKAADAKKAIEDMADPQLNNLGREIKKVIEKVYVAQVGCEVCKGPHYSKDYPLKKEGKILEEAYYTQLALRVKNDKVVFKSDKPTSNIFKRVYVLGSRERMELDLETRLIGKAMTLNRSQDFEFEDFRELNDLNEPLELMRNQVEDSEPTIEEGEVIDEPIMDKVKTRCDGEIIGRLDEYPSY